MTLQEQQHLKQKSYIRAMCYIANSSKMLKKAGKKGKYFKDPGYVVSANCIAYKGVLVALEALLRLNGVEVPKNGISEKNRKYSSLSFCTEHFRKLDKKLLRDLDHVYEDLYLFNYYDRIVFRRNVINDCFEIAKEIIDLIKPVEAA